MVSDNIWSIRTKYFTPGKKTTKKQKPIFPSDVEKDSKFLDR